MKKIKKIGISLLLAIIATVSVLALTACGGATLTGGYSSQAKFSHFNGLLLGYNYYTVTYAFQTIETYSDNTYVLYLSSSTFSAIEIDLESNDWTGNDKENYIIKYYGSYTSKAHSLDEDLKIFTLSSPTRVSAMFDGSYFADTANWKEEYNATAKDVNPMGGEVENTTMEKFLEKHKFDEVDVEVNMLKNSFAYISSIYFTQYAVSAS